MATCGATGYDDGPDDGHGGGPGGNGHARLQRTETQPGKSIGICILYSPPTYFTFLPTVPHWKKNKMRKQKKKRLKKCQ